MELAMVIAQRDKKLTKWFTDYSKRLQSFIRKRVSDVEEAEDIAQDVWLQVSRHPNIDDIEEIGSWLFTSARNRVIDFYRKKKNVPFSNLRHNRDDDTGEMTSPPEDIYFDNWLEGNMPDKVVESKEFWKELNAALATLPVEQREIFIANELYDVSFKEMAADSGISINTLLARKRYAVLYLRKHFENWRSN